MSRCTQQRHEDGADHRGDGDEQDQDQHRRSQQIASDHPREVAAAEPTLDRFRHAGEAQLVEEKGPVVGGHGEIQVGARRYAVQAVHVLAADHRGQELGLGRPVRRQQHVETEPVDCAVQIRS